MRLFLDACVLFPVATREILMNYAKAGGYEPLWSTRVTEEWRRAAEAKQGPEDAARAAGDAALMRAHWPEGEVTGWEPLEAETTPPDPADAHVIAAARAGGADAILTFNIRDFPLKLLRPAGLGRMHPDEFLASAFGRDGQRLEAALTPLAERAETHGVSFRAFLKRAGLPRLGKAWAKVMTS